MSRLTIRNGEDIGVDCKSCPMIKECNDDVCQMVLERLAQYEDTGATPEEISAVTGLKPQIKEAIKCINAESDYLKGYVCALSVIDGMLNSVPCSYCLNARCDPSGELTSDNDFSSCGVGRCDKGYRMSIDTGSSRPTRIIFTKWDDKCKENVYIGRYTPKFCPECGRRLYENDLP